MGLFTSKKKLAAEAESLESAAIDGSGKDARDCASFMMKNAKKIGRPDTCYIYWYNIGALRGDEVSRSIISDKGISDLFERTYPAEKLYKPGMSARNCTARVPYEGCARRPTQNEGRPQSAKVSDDVPAKGNAKESSDPFSWNFDKKTCTLVVMGGNIPDYEYIQNKGVNYPWGKHVKDIRYLEIIDVKVIGKSAFSFLKELRSVSFTGAPAVIGERAFAGCGRLTEIDLPEGVRSIGNHTFAYCTELKHMTLPGTLKMMGSQTFYGCSYLTQVDFPESLDSIGLKTFEGCGRVQRISGTKKIVDEVLRTIGDLQLQTTVIDRNEPASVGSGKAEASVNDSMDEAGEAVLMASASYISGDHEEYFRFMKIAADKGRADARYAVAECYIKGIGTDRNERAGFKYACLAADQGYADAIHIAGLCYFNGTGTRADFSKARKMFEKGVELNHTGCMNSLASIYIGGHGVPVDNEKGFKLILRSADLGDESAIQVLKDNGYV